MNRGVRVCSAKGLPVLGLLACIGWLSVAQAQGAAAPSAYELHPTEVADGVGVFLGRNEHFTRSNGGDIANTGYLVGTEGVIVIDSGPSKAYGLAQRALIESRTGKAVKQVYITHAHPDHFLGNQAYAGIPIAALPGTTAAIRSQGEALAENLYRLVGGAMSGTQALPPSVDAVPAAVSVAGRRLRLIGTDGHTDADLMVYDEQTGTLFAGDLVFFQRTATTPNADMEHWLKALDALDRLDFKILVPGHGPVVRDHSAIAQTRDYLRWLSASLQEAASRGLDMVEVLHQPIPERFRQLAVAQDEYERSVVHLYPKIEVEDLPTR